MKLYIMKGLPGSGKTTRAEELSEEHLIQIVSTDQIRRTIPSAHGEDVRRIYVGRILNHLSSGESVIADATNFGDWGEELMQLADTYGAEVEVVFMDTPVQECIRRDYERHPDERTGAAAIRAMYNKYLREESDDSHA